MKIALCGAPFSGVQEIFERFTDNWPMYTRVSAPDYDKIKNLCNVALEDVDLAMDDLVTMAMLDSGKTDVIHNGCVLDALARVFMCFNTPKEVNSNALIKYPGLVNASIRYYDIIFFNPITEEMLKNILATKEEFISAMNINTFLCAIYDMWVAGDKTLFPFDSEEGAPPIIKLGGPPEECLTLMKLYVTDKGEAFGKEDTLITPEIIKSVGNIKMSDVKKLTGDNYEKFKK